MCHPSAASHLIGMCGGVLSEDGHVCLGSQPPQCSGLGLSLSQGDWSYLLCWGVFFLPGINDVMKTIFQNQRGVKGGAPPFLGDEARGQWRLRSEHRAGSTLLTHTRKYGSQGHLFSNALSLQGHQSSQNTPRVAVESATLTGLLLSGEANSMMC